MKQVILASQSPRRKELLRRIIPKFSVCPTQADESIPAGISPAQAVELLAKRKAQACEKRNRVIIGADTIVVLDDEILGKPENGQDAAAMLQKLSGRSHRVYTGVAVREGETCVTGHACTEVVFDTLSREQIQNYVQSGEPMDKAGAYGIQGLGGLFVREIHGDYNNVVGLPLFLLGEMLATFGITIL